MFPLFGLLCERAESICAIDKTRCRDSREWKRLSLRQETEWKDTCNQYGRLSLRRQKRCLAEKDLKMEPMPYNCA